MATAAPTNAMPVKLQATAPPYAHATPRAKRREQACQTRPASGALD
jgi:hypothetical protein